MEPKIRRLASDVRRSSELDSNGDKERRAGTYTVTDGHRAVSHDTTLSSAMLPALEPEPGWRLGGVDGKRFELLERLGGGGMSVVFLARDVVLDRMVAIKFLTNDALGNDEGFERLQLEARACARLNHENIVRLFDMGMDRGLPFLVMEHLEGRPLDAIVRDDGVDARRAVRIMIDVAKGLAQAHRAGILHRDLKPSNVFIGKDGVAKILDFGVAMMTHGPGAMANGVWGTPRYMSPEQWRAEVQDCRTDIWAAGVMFFELLTGIAPFDGANISEIRGVVISPDPAPSLRALRPEMLEEADHVAQRAMTKSPAERFGTADELLDALVKLEVALAQAMRVRDEEVGGRARPKPEMRQVTVVSCTLDGLPELPGEPGLDELAASLDDFFDICSTVVRELEGTVLSLIGPHFLACFGYPTAHEDNAPRALRAASLIVDALQAERGVRIGIATSLSIVRHTESITAPVALQADALHMAQSLERRAGRNEILIGEVTEALVRSTFELEPSGETRTDGRARPQRTYRVLRPKATRFQWVTGTTSTPLVGREHELEQLRELSGRAEAGKGQFVWIAGEAGIGKSRIIAQHLEGLAPQSRSIVRCQCWPHFQNSALEPILDGLLRTMGLRRDASAEEKIQLLERILAEASLSLPDHVPLLARFLGVSTAERDAISFTSPALLERRMRNVLVTLLERASAQKPLVLVVEDAHWSDTSTLDLLDVLLGRMSATRTMVIVTARPELDPPWPRASHLHRIALGRLSSEQTSTMVAWASQGRSLPTPIVEQLVQRTDGVPLFVEELTRSVADAFHEAEQRGEVLSPDAFASGTIPRTLEGLLRARLGALPREGRDVACVAAVLGRDATYEVIRAISELGEESVRVGLMQLVETGILQRQAQGTVTSYAFKHALVREAAYQSLVKNERRNVHLRAADTLVARFPEIVARNPEVVASHFMEAGRHEQAVTYFEKAGEHASERLANIDAAAHYAHAIAQLRMLAEGEARDRRELGLQLARGMALMAAKGSESPEAQAPYARVRELAPRVPMRDAGSFQSMFGLNQFYLVAGDIASATEVARHIVALADEAGNDDMAMIARTALGPCLTFFGHFVEARDCLAAGHALYDLRKHGKLAMRLGFDSGVSTGMLLSEVLWYLGHPDRALEQARAAVTIARAVEHPFSIAGSMSSLGNCYGNRGDYGALRRVADEVHAISEKHGLDASLAVAKVSRAWARVGAGDHTAIAELEEGVSIYRAGRIRVRFAYPLSVLAWAQWRAGELDDALRTLDEMAEFIASTGERELEAEMLRLRGEVLLASGSEPSLAADCFERGRIIARQQGARALELRLAYGQARLPMDASRRDVAKERLTSVVDSFTEGLDTLDLRLARELLATL
ncbi:protein kinase domain-containing protein [Pendulispora albinea]|uniref:Protein kinase n=1 Tax=Pendulispora albinea TaxID=2741071 RepID=A0ABZ2M2C5_9BACT